MQHPFLASKHALPVHLIDPFVLLVYLWRTPAPVAGETYCFVFTLCRLTAVSAAKAVWFGLYDLIDESLKDDLSFASTG
jgi:hypothetical protein